MLVKLSGWLWYNIFRWLWPLSPLPPPVLRVSWRGFIKKCWFSRRSCGPLCITLPRSLVPPILMTTHSQMLLWFHVSLFNGWSLILPELWESSAHYYLTIIIIIVYLFHLLYCYHFMLYQMKISYLLTIFGLTCLFECT